MGTCFERLLTEEWRRRLLQLVFCLQILLSVFGAALLCAGVKIMLLLAEMDTILDQHYNGALPVMLIVVGILMAAVHSTLAYLAYTWSNWKTRPMTQMPFLLYKLGVFLVAIFVLAAACMCFSHRGVIEGAFHHGFRASMHQYKVRAEVKEVLDTMQMSYRCCGSRDYRDWMDTSWIHERFVNTNDATIRSRMRKDGYFAESLPFSCCDPYSAPPCHHYHLTSRQPITSQGVSPRGISSQGCAEGVTEHLRNNILGPVGQATFYALIIEVLVLLLFRYFQTSADLANQWGDPTQPAHGYLCMCTGNAPTPPQAPATQEEVERRQERSEARRRQQDTLQAVVVPTAPSLTGHLPVVSQPLAPHGGYHLAPPAPPFYQSRVGSRHSHRPEYDIMNALPLGQLYDHRFQSRVPSIGSSVDSPPHRGIFGPAPEEGYFSEKLRKAQEAQDALDNVAGFDARGKGDQGKDAGDGKGTKEKGTSKDKKGTEKGKGKKDKGQKEKDKKDKKGKDKDKKGKDKKGKGKDKDKKKKDKKSKKDKDGKKGDKKKEKKSKSESKSKKSKSKSKKSESKSKKSKSKSKKSKSKPKKSSRKKTKSKSRPKKRKKLKKPKAKKKFKKSKVKKAKTKRSKGKKMKGGKRKKR